MRIAEFEHKYVDTLTKLKTISKGGFLQVNSSDGLWKWLEQEQISIGFTTYQTNRLMLVGRSTNGRLAINERLFDERLFVDTPRTEVTGIPDSVRQLTK